jgi:hypothetical protein
MNPVSRRRRRIIRSRTRQRRCLVRAGPRSKLDVGPLRIESPPMLMRNASVRASIACSRFVASLFVTLAALAGANTAGAQDVQMVFGTSAGIAQVPGRDEYCREGGFRPVFELRAGMRRSTWILEGRHSIPGSWPGEGCCLVPPHESPDGAYAWESWPTGASSSSGIRLRRQAAPRWLGVHVGADWLWAHEAPQAAAGISLRTGRTFALRADVDHTWMWLPAQAGVSEVRDNRVVEVHSRRDFRHRSQGWQLRVGAELHSR